MSPDLGPAGLPAAVVKIVVAGGFGAGKTTLVGAVSEIRPLTTEAYLTAPGRDTDDLAGVEQKVTTTVAMDYGRITFADPLPLELHLFGTPGQERFLQVWAELCKGAVGALVLADTRRLGDSFPAIDFFERRAMPFVIAVNRFDGAHRYEPGEVRDALDLADAIPVVTLDARVPADVALALVTLVGHALNHAQAIPSTPTPGALA